MKRISSNLILALAAIALGVLAGTGTAVFLYAVTWGQEFLWDTLTIHLPLQALLVCTVGGLLVGLCQRYLGDYPKSIHQATKALQQNGRLEYRHLHKGIITAFTSLAFGASLGPEAAIVDLSGGLMTWAGDIMQKLRAGLHLPQRTDGLAASIKSCVTGRSSLHWLPSCIPRYIFSAGCTAAGSLHR